MIGIPAILQLQNARAVNEKFHPAELRPILQAVSDETGISIVHLKGTLRTVKVAQARQLYIWLSHRLTGQSFVAITALINKNNTTSGYSIRTIDERYISDRAFATRCDRLIGALGGD